MTSKRHDVAKSHGNLPAACETHYTPLRAAAASIIGFKMQQQMLSRKPGCCSALRARQRTPQVPALHIRSTAAHLHRHLRSTSTATAAAAGGSGGGGPGGDSDASSSAPSTSYATTSSSGGGVDDGEALQQGVFPELQLQLPEPTNALVKTAEFVKSSVRVAECPPARLPEFAVIGRSNVGKSSLINMLTNRKSLAMVSKEPGKTRCINHFLINNSWHLVDLPGYGYARTGRDTRREFDSFTKAYFLQRPTLVMVLLLVDSSIPPQPVDLEYAAWLGRSGVPFALVFTKHDKRKKGGPRKGENIAGFKAALVERHGFAALPPSLVTSAAAGTGKRELLAFIAGLRVLFEQAAAGAAAKRTKANAS